jgi:hypothetical protein
MKTALIACAALVIGCGGGDDDAADAGNGNGDAGVIELGDPCPLDDKVGVFEIAQRELYAAVTGQVATGVIPSTILFPEGTEGGCTLLRKINPFCDPPCQPGQVCSQAEQCVAYPENQSIGTVTITGMLQDVEIEPNVVNSYQDTSIPNPPFDSDSLITLTAAGDTLEGFTLHGYGVTTIDVTDESWTIFEDQDLAISWTPSDDNGRIWATFNVDQHGNSPVTMFCDLEDTGSADIPSALLASLLDLGLSGVASAHVFRRTVDSVQIAEGCVELDVLSHVQVGLEVDGFTPEPFP